MAFRKPPIHRAANKPTRRAWEEGVLLLTRVILRGGGGHTNWKGKFVLTFPLLSHSWSKLICASDLERQGLLVAGGSWKQMFWSNQFETRTCPVEHCKML